MKYFICLIMALATAVSAMAAGSSPDLFRIMATRQKLSATPAAGVKVNVHARYSSADQGMVFRLLETDSVLELGGINTTVADGARYVSPYNTTSCPADGPVGAICTLPSGVYWYGTKDSVTGWHITGSSYDDTAVWNAVNDRVTIATYEANNAAISARFNNMSSQISSLRAAFVAGGGTLSPASNSPLPALAFGNVEVNSTSTLNTTIENTGLANLVFGTVTETDASNKFSITADACSGQTLAPSASCLISVMFSPGAVAGGPYTAQLSYPHNAAGSPTLIALSGTGVSSGPTPTFAWYAESNSFPQYANEGGQEITKASTNAGVIVAGHTGNAISQNGANFTYWGFPGGTTLTPASGKISMWVKHDTAAGSGDTSQRFFFRSSTTGTANTIYAYTKNSTRELWFFVYDSAGVVHRTYTTTGDWAANTWYQYDFEWDAAAGTTTVKRDGAICTTTSSGQTAWNANLPDWSGAMTIGYIYPLGVFDDIYIY